MRERNEMILADLIAARAERQPDLDVLTFERLSVGDGTLPDEVRTYADLHTQRQPHRGRAHRPRPGAWRALRADDAQPSGVRGDDDRRIDHRLRVRADRPAHARREAGVHAAPVELPRHRLRRLLPRPGRRDPCARVPDLEWILALETERDAGARIARSTSTRSMRSLAKPAATVDVRLVAPGRSAADHLHLGHHRRSEGRGVSERALRHVRHARRACSAIRPTTGPTPVCR